VVGEGDFAGPGDASSTDECAVRNRMMRRPERPLRDQGGPRGEQARDRVDLCRFDRFVERQLREDGGDPS